MSKKIGVLAVIISLASLCCSAICLCVMLFGTNGAKTEPATENDSMQYVMYVGTNDKDTYQPKYTEEEAKNIVDTVCLKYFEGYTLQEAVGAWTDEKNNFTHEYTLVCYFDGADKETVYKAADEVIQKLNQNSVLIEQDNISMEYYSGNK